MICKGSGAQGSVGRVADATAEADRALHHHVPSTQGPPVRGGTRLLLREESASVQTGAAGV